MLKVAKPQRRLSGYGCTVWIPAYAGTTTKEGILIR